MKVNNRKKARKEEGELKELKQGQVQDSLQSY